jgi:hypothetical protein
MSNRYQNFFKNIQEIIAFGIVVFFSLILVLFISIVFSIANYTDKIILIVIYAIGFLISFYVLKFIFLKSKNYPEYATLFLVMYTALSILSIFAAFLVPKTIKPSKQTPITQQKVIESFSNVDIETKIQILKANGLSRESVYDVLKNDYNFKILIKDGNSTFEKIYDDMQVDIDEKNN